MYVGIVRRVFGNTFMRSKPACRPRRTAVRGRVLVDPEETWPPDMRIAYDLSISRVRKAGKSLAVRSAARYTRGRSGRTRLGPDRRHESARGHSLSLVPESGWPLPLSKPTG